MNAELKPIGVIHSPFHELEGMPIQPAGARGVQGTVEVFQEYRAGLKDLDGFSHIVLLYLFHQSQGFLAAMIHRWSPEAKIEKIDTVFRAPVLVDQPHTISGTVTGNRKREQTKKARTLKV